MKKIILVNLLLLVVSVSSVFTSEPVQCKDENNNPVDWFFIYKFPRIKSSKNSLVKSGRGYMFITDTQVDEGWQISDKGIDSSGTPIANSLAFLQTPDKDQLLWIVYNDQGDVECETCGHTKGFVAGDSSGGYWIIHSVPHYLQDEYPKTGLMYGQSALCISLNQTNLDAIGDLLKKNEPSFQKWNLDSKLKVLYPKIMAALENRRDKAPYNLQISITSKGGTEFQGFAKSRYFHTDLYEWVAERLKQDLYAETWLHEGGVLPSTCNTQYRVINVLSMAYQKIGLMFSSQKDHSKLAVAVSGSKPWVCVGDINRAKSQERRGGGTVCMKNSKLWKLYNSLVNSTEQCLPNKIKKLYHVKQV